MYVVNITYGNEKSKNKKINLKLNIMYTIYYKQKNNNCSQFEQEMFLTGGKKYDSFKDCNVKKNKLQKMTSSFIYKTFKV